MQKRSSAELGLFVCLLAGCTTWTNAPPATVETEPSAVWIQNPRAYAEEIASSSEHERERVREQALNEFLKAPSAEQQVRLSLVYDAATVTLADSYASADSLAHVLGDASALSADTRAVLASLLLRTERRIDDLRAIASRETELIALRDAYHALEAGKATSEARYAALQRALRDAEAKLDALKSIERTLEGNSIQPPREPSGEGEASEDTTP